MKRLRYLGISPPPAAVSGTVSALAVPARREGPAAESPAPPPVPVAPVATVRGEGEELVGARTKARTPSAVFARFALVGTIGFLVDAAVLSLLLHGAGIGPYRSEEHTSELQSLMRISYAVFCLKKKKKTHER